MKAKVIIHGNYVTEMKIERQIVLIHITYDEMFRLYYDYIIAPHLFHYVST